ncbi:Adenine phosphoribosyltransferase 1 [Schistosoma japonicum]|nr:Adenine phosphoribosyltransferase 1 [Schistosoma japonicum]KAH8868637.1 Adenine phosphoribosyltransferase 1 [Schistosoma japonicum]KAH8868638.1 Adenine phosphoribosyltransferase 1 [Schistosoma japonicum]
MCDRESKLKAIESAVAIIPDFPKKGVFFRDFFGVFKNPILTQYLLDELYYVVTSQIECESKKVDVIVGLESRGFLLGPALALRLNCSFVPIRKAGKLPGPCFSHKYELEYGTDTVEMQKDAVKLGDNVILLDDVLVTGGSLDACAKLISLSGAKLLSCLVFMELKDFGGRRRIESLRVSLHSLFQV